LASTVARDFDEDGSANGRGDIAVGMGEAAQKGVQNGVIERPRHNSRSISGEADLLLMVPPLRKLAGVVEPDERGHLSGPRDAEGAGGERIERFIEVCCLGTGELHELCEDGGAETAVDSDAFAVEAVDEGDKVLMRANVYTFDAAFAAAHGELTQSGVEQVRSDVANAPLRYDGWQVPLSRIE